MSPHDDERRLRDMLDYARKAVYAVRSAERTDLEIDEILGAALERFVEIIGDAANRVSDARKQAMPEIPWKQIIGLSNRLIHGYTAVDQDVLWDVVHDDLPRLIARLEDELNGL